MPGHLNPLPVGDRLPGVFDNDAVVQDFCAGLDEVLAPIVLTLDCLPAYLDPVTTPADMIGWLADWLGVNLDPRQSVAQQRHLLRKTAKLLQWRGTAKGLRDVVEFIVGVRPEIIETGGSQWSETPGTPLPGQPGDRVVVRLVVADPTQVDARRVGEIVAAITPAHIRYVIEIVTAA
jgi:phage tail-like protein